MIGTFLASAGRVTSAQTRPYFVGTLTISWTGSAASAATGKSRSRTRARAARMGARNPPRPGIWRLGDDGQVPADQPVASLGHVVDVVAVDLEGEGAVVQRAHDQAVEVLEGRDAPVARDLRATGEHAPDDGRH